MHWVAQPALGVDEELRSWLLGAHPVDVVGLDPGVHVALARPHDHRLAGDPLDVGAQPHVRAEQDLDVLAVLGPYVLDHLHGVGRGAAVVGLRLDLGARC